MLETKPDSPPHIENMRRRRVLSVLMMGSATLFGVSTAPTFARAKDRMFDDYSLTRTGIRGTTAFDHDGNYRTALARLEDEWDIQLAIKHVDQLATLGGVPDPAVHPCFSKSKNKSILKKSFSEIIADYNRNKNKDYREMRVTLIEGFPVTDSALLVAKEIKLNQSTKS